MNDVVIRAEGLGKRYKLGQSHQNYKMLRHALAEAFTKAFHRVPSKIANNKFSAIKQESNDYIWALNNVSFEIKQGEVLGIIGRNGSGKSTLLKILSRITEPTKGYAEIHGRVGALLEVGTGFHPELTGRENIFLNAAILGMKKVEIKRNFDEIVAFSEIEKFIDTPVKHYSSGMYVRLAFAVAAHLDPEILLIDEVLAVGDVGFQKKCLGKMDDVAKQGRTVVFVSHNMGAMMQLCPESILLQNGLLISRGASKDIVDQYLASLSVSGDGSELAHLKDRSGDGRLRFVNAYLQDEKGKQTHFPIAGHPVDIVLEFIAQENLSHVQFMITLYNSLGIPVTHCDLDAYGKRIPIAKGNGKIECHIPRLPLPKGRYRIAIGANDDLGHLDGLSSASTFDVETSSFYPTSYTPPLQHSTVLIDHSWMF